MFLFFHRVSIQMQISHSHHMSLVACLKVWCVPMTYSLIPIAALTLQIHTVRQMLFINQTIPANHPKEGLVVFHIFMSERIIFGEQKPNELCYNQLSVIYFETIKYKYV